MPWLKSGDNAATHPIVMRVAAFVMRVTTKVLERDVAVNEVFGFVTRCALQSAGHTTDYVIDYGTVQMIGGARTDRLVELARKAGYLKPIRQGGLPAWRLVNDPDFLHMRLKEEIDWERQQRADNANPALVVPVRLRDGDACRYCGHIVNWRARKGNRNGTYDHREAGKSATVATLVVACGACNAGRRDDPNADERYPLRPAPSNPYYSEHSAAYLTEHGHLVAHTEDQRPGSQPDHAPATSQPASPRPAAKKRAPASHPRSADSADRQPTESGFAGSGRDGSGLHSQFKPDPAGTGIRASPPRRKRSTRGRPRTGGSR